MTRSSRQRRARIQAALHAEAGRTAGIHSYNDPDVPLRQTELYEISQYDQSHSISIQNEINVLNHQEQELVRRLDVFDVLLADPYLPEAEMNDILNQQAHYVQQVEIFRQQQESLRQQEVSHRGGNYSESQEGEVHHNYLEEEEVNDAYFHHEMLVDQQLDEQIREIEQFEANQRHSERFSAAMFNMLSEQGPARPVPPPVVHRPSNRNRSFKGLILNPSQDETNDDSTNTRSSTAASTQLSVSSPGSSTTILSADFGDDDVLPIEETSCVICCVDYRHGDEILRNANDGRNINSSSNSNHQSNSSSHMSTVTCNHVFHANCITSWIVSSGKSDCPCCRSPFALTTPT